MFSLEDGRPIAKSDRLSKNKIILSIIDPDQQDERETKKPVIIPKKKGNGGCKFKGCGSHNKKPCCRHCDEEECPDLPCCNNCRIYYAEDFTETSSDNSDAYSSSESSECQKSHSEKGLQMTRFTAPRDTKLVPLPDLTERFVEYIAGPSGSGKSHIASGLATEFKRINPRKPVYIFSRTDARKDPVYRNLKPIQIDINETLLEDPIDITDEIKEGGALMIFDDCGTIQDDKLRKEVEKLMSDAMEVGRKLNCNIIITNHLVIPNEKKFARTVLNEFNTLTVFPKSGSSQQIRYALKTYVGLNNKQIDDILALKSRWVRISKSYPQYVLYDKGAYIL